MVSLASTYHRKHPTREDGVGPALLAGLDRQTSPATADVRAPATLRDGGEMSSYASLTGRATPPMERDSLSPGVNVAVVAYLVGLVAAAALTAAGWWAVRTRAVPAARVVGRARRGLDELLGPIGAATSIALAGMTAVIGVLWLVGAILARQEDRIDRPVYNWMRDHQMHGSLWWHLNDQVSAMGNNDRTKVVIVIAGVVLAVLWRRRAWWIPPLALCAAYLGERFTQQLLKLAVHRGHPPTTLGTYPSGGCGRLIAVSGVALLLLFLHYPQLHHRWRATGWTALALAAYSQGYSRTYLLKHWLTDVLGGWLFGAALLAVFSTATLALVHGHDLRTAQRASNETPSRTSTPSHDASRLSLPSR